MDNKNRLHVASRVIRGFNSNIYQSRLVETLFQKGLIHPEDIQNPTEYGEYMNWVAFPNIETSEALFDKKSLTYIETEYGMWIARHDYGSKEECQFIPDVISAALGINFTYEHWREFKKHEDEGDFYMWIDERGPKEEDEKDE